MPPPQKILVLGSRGRLGGTLARRCAEAGMDVLAWGRGQLDLLRPDAIETTLANVEFDCLLNAAGTTAVDDCERHPEAVRAANALSPARLASVCAARGARGRIDDYRRGPGRRMRRRLRHRAHRASARRHRRWRRQ